MMEIKTKQCVSQCFVCVMLTVAFQHVLETFMWSFVYLKLFKNALLNLKKKIVFIGNYHTLPSSREYWVNTNINNSSSKIEMTFKLHL